MNSVTATLAPASIDIDNVNPYGSSARCERDADSWVRSVERALTLLEALASSSMPFHLSDLARATGMPKATVHRILNSLVGREFAARVGNNYTLGSRLFELTADAQQAEKFQRLLMPYLLELYRSTRGVVSVGVLSRFHVLYSNPLHDQRSTPRIRKTVPAHCTALGKLLLAYQPSAIARLGNLGLTKLTENTVSTVDDLISQLTVIRRRGIAYSREERVGGEIEVAAPVFTTRRRIITGLSVTGAVETFDFDMVAFHARRVAYLASVYCQERRLPACLGATAKAGLVAKPGVHSSLKERAVSSGVSTCGFAAARGLQGMTGWPRVPPFPALLPVRASGPPGQGPGSPAACGAGGVLM
jgi:IclR family transcriptional regulator, KDG regulon repressor